MANITPTVLSVSPAPPTLLGIGDVLTIVVQFDGEIDVTAGSELELNNGGWGQLVTTPGTGLTQLTYTYTVEAGETDVSDLGVMTLSNVVATDVADTLVGFAGPEIDAGVAVDANAPNHPTIDAVATDNIVSAGEVAGLVIKGTTDDNEEITIKFSGETRTVTANGGNWSYSITTDDLKIMKVGMENIVVTAKDAAGNESVSEDIDIEILTGAIPGSTPTKPVSPIIAGTNNAVGVDLSSAKAQSATITTASGATIPNPLYQTAQQAATIQADLANGRISDIQATARLADLAEPTTGVAHMSYNFFAGVTPTAAGMKFLINSEQNPNDLTDAYYAPFSTENRFINFAVNLGRDGQGKEAFAAKYGALTFEQTVSKVYDDIIGLNLARSIGINVDQAVSYIISQKAYFQAYGGTEIGAKAAMAGYILSAAADAGLGSLYQDSRIYIVNQINGSSSLMVDDSALV